MAMKLTEAQKNLVRALADTFDDDCINAITHALDAQADALGHVDRAYPAPEVREDARRLRESSVLIALANIWRE